MKKILDNKILLAIVFLAISTSNISVANANDVQRFNSFHKYALISNAAYYGVTDVKKVIDGSGYTLTKHGELPGYHVSYFLLSNHKLKKHVLAVRGTSNVENAMVDLALKLLPNKHTGIKLHQGFALTADLIYNEIKNSLNKSYQINTTGHSLGGAAALILAMYFDSSGYNVGKVVTFGQPKVTNISGSKHYSHLNVTRLVMPRDMVPLVPPMDAMDIMNVDIYWHQGVEVVLLERNTYSQLDGINSLLRATKFLNEVISEKNIQQHYMSKYISSLELKRANPVRIPYSNSFSISNFLGG